MCACYSNALRLQVSILEQAVCGIKQQRSAFLTRSRLINQNLLDMNYRCVTGCITSMVLMVNNYQEILSRQTSVNPEQLKDMLSYMHTNDSDRIVLFEIVRISISRRQRPFRLMRPDNGPGRKNPPENAGSRAILSEMFWRYRYCCCVFFKRFLSEGFS